ncbi:unnamed protein product [Rotaria sp. Silwood2]|nr:unnamed protein product [Rotaria sp. Silwood2]CAF2737145.1 unnamed protein product [Rotaria sp. Silwood2]CAF3127927.1 unnamed protein product [Rotaria sp. Silwood2]CAF3869106.1 unnamed protein product [Rotaria sp. Silwood2]CAF4103906.1 unnamed protein product [Rotaria sp. Silwood2]
MLNTNYRSTILPNTSKPIWNDEEWIVRNIPPTAKLTVKIYDKDDGKLADDYIGRFIIPDLINYDPPSKGHKIIGVFNQYNGRFHLSIQTTKTSEETKQLSVYTYDGPCRYFRHNSLAIGRLTMINADSIYPTWKIQMRRISYFFPPHERQYWNTQYQSARTIFDNYPLSIVIQGGIKLLHRTLYRKTLKNNDNGRLKNGDDLWKFLFFDKATQQIRPCIYTYIIDDNTWRFSETGNQFFTDFASKHALLANSSEYVCYAGEFHPRPKYGWNRLNDEWELVFDNKSGTYSPVADLLVNLKELLLFNFPGLNIVTYDYKDAELKQSLEELRLTVEKYNIVQKQLKTYQPL